MFTCKDVYISNNTGFDQHNCGKTSKSPCKTINYALNDSVVDNDIIVLMSSFNIEQPLLIYHNMTLTFKSVKTSSSITCNTSLIKVRNYSLVNLMFNQTTFIDVSLFKIETSTKAKISVAFNTCSILQGTKEFIAISNDDIGVDINVNNCTFRPLNSSSHPKVPNSFFTITKPQHSPKSKIYFSNVTVSGNMTLQTFFTCKECFLDWKNVLFEDCNVQTALSLSLTDGKIHSLNVRRCISSSGSEHDFYFINLDRHCSKLDIYWNYFIQRDPI